MTMSLSSNKCTPRHFGGVRTRSKYLPLGERESTEGGRDGIRVASNTVCFEARREEGVQLIMNILLQGKLELITGATASLMKLQLFDDNDKLVCELCDDTATLGSTSVKDGYRLHVSWMVSKL